MAVASRRSPKNASHARGDAIFIRHLRAAGRQVWRLRCPAGQTVGVKGDGAPEAAVSSAPWLAGRHDRRLGPPAYDLLAAI
ncbi:MAG: hypothetical protein R3F11_16265 [Verrucomicrobiales bacterium]